MPTKKVLIGDAMRAFRTLAKELPAARCRKRGEDIMAEHGWSIDLLVSFADGAQETLFACALRGRAEPKLVRSAIRTLQNAMDRRGIPAVPVYVAPRLCADTQQLCRQLGGGYLDMQGNAWLPDANMRPLVECCLVAKTPVPRGTRFRGPFAPKGERVLAVLLADPAGTWRSERLAQAADVSMGVSSKALAVLVEEGLCRDTRSGVVLTSPAALVERWVELYEPPRGRLVHLRTDMRGTDFDEALHDALAPTAALAALSAARWQAPYLRAVPIDEIYCDASAVGWLTEELQAEPAHATNCNVVLRVLEDPSLVLRDVERPADGVACTPPLRTYLDLCAIGRRREQEAAEHLRKQLLPHTLAADTAASAA